jgi:PAS domain S-box-containing protein
MTDQQKAPADPIAELERMKARVAELEQTESELKRVADAFKQSETKFRKITEKSIVGVYLIQDDLFLYTNPHMAEIFGFEVHELIHKKGPEHVVYPEDWPIVSQHLKERIAGKMESINYQFRGMKRNGEIIHVEVYGSRMDYNGRPAVIGTLVDITRRVGMERNLEKQLQKFQALYHLAIAMTAERRLEENLGMVVEKSRELLEADTAFIALREEDAGELLVRAGSGITADELADLKIPSETVGAFRKIQGRQERHLRQYFEALQIGFPGYVRKEGIISGLAVPVNIGLTNLGVLCVGNLQRKDYTESEIETIWLMGNLAALETTRKTSEEALAQSEKQLRSLSRQLMTAQEDERKRVAQELHDGIGQSLTAMKFEVENAMRKIAADVPENHLGPLTGVFPLIENVIEEVSRIAMDLRPSILDDLGVLATIGWLCREFGKTYSGIHLKKQIELEENHIPEIRKIVIFRILQEALNNVAKHSQASLVEVRLLEKDARVELIVQDDGVGFDRDTALFTETGRQGFGLASMKERARLSGGSFFLEAAPGTGTILRASWPHEAESTV